MEAATMEVAESVDDCPLPPWQDACFIQVHPPLPPPPPPPCPSGSAWTWRCRHRVVTGRHSLPAVQPCRHGVVAGSIGGVMIQT